MSARKGGTRRKSRHKLMKSFRTRGKISVTRYLREFTNGEQVVLLADSAVHEGLYHPRFHGKNGEVVGKQGRCYYIKITDGGKNKQILVHPIHLTKVTNGQTATA
ncbi:50S ribosomal protein L21e [Candidatus Woesearchaeota archaeon]|nr:50S ribosomal protein L21e [Candidatus Woesearchaeota archaeon]